MKKIFFTLMLGVTFYQVDVYAQTTGINTLNPTEALDVGSGNIRVRDINSNVGDGTTDRVVVADANGVLKTLDSEDYTFFHAKLQTDQILSSNALANTVMFGTPTAISPFYSYDTTTGILTFNDPGLYYITYQLGLTDFDEDTHILLGVLDVASGLYVGRGSNWAAVARSGNVGQISSYVTMLDVPNAGYQIRFTAYAGSSGSARLLANETGATGSGNVTNITIQKTK